MGSVGDCFDNAVCETFHATLKKERIYRQSWPTRAAARTAIFSYIEGWYNPRRRHSTLGYLSPIEFERHHPKLAQPAVETSISVNGSVAVGVNPIANGRHAPENGLAPGTGSAQAATTLSRDEQLVPGLFAR
jgi:Integrase core domain